MERHQEGQERTSDGLEKEQKLSFAEKEEHVEVALEKARELREEEKYEKGINKLLDALQLGVNEDDVYYRLGNIYFDSGDLDRAEYAYNRAIEENDEHVNAQHNLAVVYKEQGKISKSVKQRKKANKIELENPKEPDLSEEERSYAKWFAFKLLLMIIGGFLGLGLIIYLVAVFFF